MLIAMPVAYFAHRSAIGFFTAPLSVLDIGFVLLMVIFFAGSRDTLRKYNERLSQVLVPPSPTTPLPAQHEPADSPLGTTLADQE